MRSFVVGLALLGTLAACDSATANNSSTLSLSEHQAQWENRSFHSYSFDYLRAGIGSANVHVVVTNDAVTSVSDASTGVAPVVSLDIPPIDALFATAHTLTGQKHVELDFQFDSQLGYPTLLSAFAVPANPGGGYEVRVSNLHPIQ